MCRSTSQGHRRNAPPQSPSARARRQSVADQLPGVLQAEDVGDLGSATILNTLGVRLHRIQGEDGGVGEAGAAPATKWVEKGMPRSGSYSSR